MPPQHLPLVAVSTATGAAQWTFPPVTMGSWWHVACIVPTAPTGAVMQLLVNGSPRLKWIGPLPSAAVVVTQASRITVKAAGLAKSTGYTALLTGSWSRGAPAGVPPAGPSSFSTASITGPVSITTSGTLDVTVTSGQLTRTGVPNQFITSQFPNSWLGSGADGAAVITADTTLTRDMQYTSLTIDAGVTFKNAGYRVRCTGTVTVKGTWTASGTDGGGLSTAIHGGAGGAGAPAGTLGGGYAGGKGGLSALAGTPGTSVGTNTLGGGAGGHGGKHPTEPAGGAGGAGGTAPSAFATVTTVTDKTIDGGAGGGGGGGGGVSITGMSTAGGGGGGGGGVVLLVCTRLVMTGGLIRANGGAGGAAFNNPTFKKDGGAGGGGGGGVVLVLCHGVTGLTSTNIIAIGGAAGTMPTYRTTVAPGADGYVTVLVTG